MSDVLDRMTRAEIALHITPREIAVRARDAVESYWPGAAGDELARLRARIRMLEFEDARLRDELRREKAARLQVEENAVLLRHALTLLAPKGPGDAG